MIIVIQNNISFTICLIQLVENLKFFFNKLKVKKRFSIWYRKKIYSNYKMYKTS